MTDKEIIKALECCSKSDAMLCYGCPFTKNCSRGFISRNALDLINRQQAEIERLREELASKGLKHSLLEREKAEDISGFVDDLKLARADAIKEFAERLKNSLKGYGGLYCRTTMNVRIDNLVKEMVGEQG